MTKRRDWALDAQQKIDAREALDILDGSGLTLAEAARRAISGVQRAEKSLPIDQAIAAFLRAKREDRLRSSTLEWYGRELGRLGEHFGKRTIDTITRAEIGAYVKARVAGVRPGVFRCVRAFFRWATWEEPPLIAADPTRGMKYETPKRRARIPILTVAQTAKLLSCAGEYTATLALALFAGLRPEEIAGRDKARLTWDAVHEAEQKIVVPLELDKIGVGRSIENLPPAVWPWLAAVKGERKGPIAPGRFRQAARAGRAALGLKVWPKDITRHTFASYAVAFSEDPGKVALWLGHEGEQRTLYRHYRAVGVSRAEAQRYFALVP